MNCTDWERLFDAYLDGQLGGSLRLEFDAHRLRCRRCQQTLAMMEVCAHVLAADNRVPAMSDDFTDRVMASVAYTRPAARPLRITRVAALAGSMLSAAAILVLAFLTPWTNTGDVKTAVPVVATSEVVDPIGLNGDVDIRLYILDKVDAARANLASEFGQLARYPLAMTVPEDVARASEKHPLFNVIEMLVPAPQDDDAAGSESNQYAL